MRKSCSRTTRTPAVLHAVCTIRVQFLGSMGVPIGVVITNPESGHHSRKRDGPPRAGSLGRQDLEPAVDALQTTPHPLTTTVGGHRAALDQALMTARPTMSRRKKVKEKSNAKVISKNTMKPAVELLVRANTHSDSCRVHVAPDNARSGED